MTKKLIFNSKNRMFKNLDNLHYLASKYNVCIVDIDAFINNQNFREFCFNTYKLHNIYNLIVDMINYYNDGYKYFIYSPADGNIVLEKGSFHITL